MKSSITACAYFLSAVLMLFTASACDELEKDMPEKLNPVNPLDPQYIGSAPSPQQISSFDVRGPALILHAPQSRIKAGYVFPLYLLAKDVEETIGISACIEFPRSVEIISISKKSSHFNEDADGLACYYPPLEESNTHHSINISATRLGGLPQGYTGSGVVVTLIAKITSQDDVTFAFESPDSCQLRTVSNDTIIPREVRNESVYGQ